DFAAQGYRLRGLLRTVALSKAFSRVQDDPRDGGDTEYAQDRQSVASSR
ncbi:MAG: hypothetical protein NWP69_02965, partial [Congregibacter sp.]|nr:hypothetical protein [Congregibacter sp.]